MSSRVGVDALDCVNSVMGVSEVVHNAEEFLVVNHVKC